MKDITKQIDSNELEESMAQYSKLTQSDPEFFLEAAELLVEVLWFYMTRALIVFSADVCLSTLTSTVTI